MKNTNTLYRNSGLFFGVFFIAVLAAFWPSYFSRLGQQATYHPHAHGIALTAWCVLLVAQAFLIRLNRRAVHKVLGKASYVLVPIIVVTTIQFIHFRLSGIVVFPDVALYLLALIINALVIFMILYGLAIYHRREPAVHARYMLCTIFPLFTPVTDRLIGAHLPGLLAWVPRIDGVAVAPVAGFMLADLLLIWLSIWDWRAKRRVAVFPIALGLLLVYHVSVLTFHRIPAWRSFAEWFVALPLS